MTEDQQKKIKFLFEENAFCSRFLIERDFREQLEKTINDARPIADAFWSSVNYMDDFQRMKDVDPLIALQIVEENSPVLLNKDLAAIALIRKGHQTESRVDRVTAMVSFEPDTPEKNFEAAFSISHWRNWNTPVSKWFQWNTFFDLIDTALNDSRYDTWAAYSFVWALTQNGGKISLQDQDYSELLWHFKELLQHGLNQQDPDLQTACSVALGEMQNWSSQETFSDLLGKTGQQRPD